MSSQKYESGQLNSILESSFAKNASGILSLQTQVSHWHTQRNCILMLRHGALVYGEINVSKIPSNKEICQALGKQFKPELINAALSVAADKITSPNSVRELLELLTKMRVFTWQEVEALVLNQVVLILEQFLSNPGQARWQATDSFDLSYGVDQHGLNWLDIKQEISQRQQKWHQYAPTIPRMDAIPFVSLEQLEKISDRNVKKHLTSSADGKNTLFDIADKMGKDPLKVAKSYINWSNNGWVSLGIAPKEKVGQTVNGAKSKIQSMRNQIKSQDSSANINKTASIVPNSSDQKSLPIVLSVDDSAIIQISIKRALQEQYQVLLANKAADALKMLNENPVELLLLDLTMPDVDGLEFCKTVRKIDKFQDLPIVMVTARDGFVNKMKGQIAGSSRYLTKPFKPEELREVVGEYIK